jgi:hypothetical protein
MEKEIWKKVEGFEDYQVSNLGKVKSLKFGKGKILKPCVDNTGYLKIVFCVNSIHHTRRIHQLVAIAFLNHEPCGYKSVVNHKDFDKFNNRVDNLEVVSARENTNRKHLKSSSIYTGVSFNKARKKWVSQIRINGKQTYFGLFKTDLEASHAYQNALKNL